MRIFPTVIQCAVLKLPGLRTQPKIQVEFVTGVLRLEASPQEQWLYKTCAILGEGNLTSVPPSYLGWQMTVSGNTRHLNTLNNLLS